MLCGRNITFAGHLMYCRKTDRNIAPLHAAVFGAGARAVAATTFLPFTVIKTRYEVSCGLALSLSRVSCVW